MRVAGEKTLVDKWGFHSWAVVSNHQSGLWTGLLDWITGQTFKVKLFLSCNFWPIRYTVFLRIEKSPTSISSRIIGSSEQNKNRSQIVAAASICSICGMTVYGLAPGLLTVITVSLTFSSHCWYLRGFKRNKCHPQIVATASDQKYGTKVCHVHVWGYLCCQRGQGQLHDSDNYCALNDIPS